MDYLIYKGKNLPYRVSYLAFKAFEQEFRKPYGQMDESNPEAELEFYLPIEGGRLIKKYVFHHDKYSADVIIAFENLQGYLGPQRWYSVRWENGLPATEENVSEDYDYASAYAYQNGELTEYDVSEDKEKPEYPSGPSTGWVAIRTKYFMSSIS